MHLLSRLLVFVAALASFFVSTPASATVLLNDTMTRPSRTAAPSDTGAQWFAIGPGMTVAYTAGELKLTHATGNGGQLLGYLTASASPVNLAVGQSAKVTFTFSLVGALGTITGDTTFRFGFFNTGAQRIAADITTASSSGLFVNYTGYAAMMSPATSGSSIRRRIPSAGTNQTNLIGTATNVFTGALVSGSSQALQANVNYTGVLTATRTAAGTEFSFAVTGPGVSAYQLTYTDTTAAVLSFDALAFGWSNAMMQSGGGLAIRALTLEVGNLTPPPPPPPPYTGTNPAANPDPGRPFIWVRESERAAIIAKINGQTWSQNVRDALLNRVAANVASHQADRDAFLRQLPVNWSDPVPNFKTMLNTSPQSEVRTPAVAKFNLGLDCAVLYYLTGEAKYGQCAADILHNVVKTLLPVTPSSSLTNGGWIVQNDLLLEARILGTQLPMIYDFMRPFLETNKVYDVTSAGLVDFDYLKTQSVFRTYYELTRDHGSKESNWSALMSTCMLNNLLALSDPAERAAALTIYLTNSSSRQASLSYDYRHFTEPGNVWPESLQYAGDVVAIRSTHMILLERYDPSLNLLGQYPNFPLSLSRLSHLRYPNGEQISFGDGHRYSEGEPYFEYELVYQHAQTRNRPDLAASFGAAINRGVASGAYNRGALRSYEALGLHNETLQLLWFAPTVAEAPVPLVLPATDRLPYAGIALQRNLSPTGDPLHGLMGFVGGAGHVHSHASGMSMELYGLGQVLGAKSGRTVYQSTDHENYYRLFASNNTVIVNGASRGQGGWEDIGINTVGVAAMEPAVGRAPVSPDHSFTTSTFADDRGTLAEATQQRTLGIVRTSATTGYYVDIFRSQSALPNEYHDYIYRNVGDTVTLESDAGPLALTAAPGRFASDIGDSYQQPGWRYFTGTEVSAPTGGAVRADFSATLPAGETHMRMFMPGAGEREYARVSSPAIVEAPAPYDDRRAPAVVIRKYGSAWNQPFAAVFEPHLGSPGSGTVRSVQALEQGGMVVGLQVGSTVGGRNLVQYVLSNPNANEVYEDRARGLSFKGRYAVVTDYGDGSGTLYLGEGSMLAFRGNSVATPNGSNAEAYVEFTAGRNSVVNSNQLVVVTSPPTIAAPPVVSGTYGQALNASVTTTGQPAPVLSVTSMLPPGLQFDATTGVLSGVAGAAGDFPVQFSAASTAGRATAETMVSVARAPATITLIDLVQTYTGQLLAPTVTTVPAGLPVQLAYSNGGTPRDSGTYEVTATIASPNHVGSTTATFVIRKAAAMVSLGGMVQSYTGQPLTPTASTNPAGLPVAVAFAGGSTPTNAGSYPVTATVNSNNHEGSASGTFEIRKAAATVTLGAMVQSYTGQPLAPTASTNPAGLPVAIAFAGGSTPTNAGSYPVTATVSSDNHEGSASGTFEIRRALATVTLAGLDQAYDGTPRAVTVSTNPLGLAVEVTYDERSAAPVYPKDYVVLAAITDPNYEGEAIGILSVSTTALVREMPQLLGGIDGSVQQLAGRDVMLSGNAWVAGDLLVPGTPDLLVQGNALFGTSLAGSGATEPKGYAIRLKGNAALRSLVRQIDATQPAVPAAPPATTGTIDYTLTRPDQQVGDFSAMRHLSLSGNAGPVVVPPGKYGNLSATGRASLVLGVAGATTPSEYSVQSISLNGESSLRVVGPILLRVDRKVEILGSASVAAAPGHLRVELHHGDFILDGRSVLVGSIRAPEAKVILRGQTEVRGRIVARELEIQAGALLTDPQLAH